MTYQETITYLFNSAPLFQNVGQGAYKEGLSTTYALDEHFGHPHSTLHTIHVAGTNGKGSCSHTLAAILQSAGYKVGLYTSPHLVDFRERIRVNGIPVDEQFVIDFVEQHRHFFEPLHPSFFELTTAMAFHYFAKQEVDVAVIEVGLGGRLDCTNIISPDLCVITNISPDHTALLGDTLAKIATEKAGIIKPHTPVIIGEYTPETRDVFAAEAQDKQAPITFASDSLLYTLKESHIDHDIYRDTPYGDLRAQLRGYCQEKNVNTLLHAVGQLRALGYNLSDEAIHQGFAHVCQFTGLMGRWQQLCSSPRLVCDTGHNIGGFRYIVPQLVAQTCRTLRIVFGMVNDKDINGVLALMPRHATYYFTQASVTRALDSQSLQALALQHGLIGTPYPTVEAATRAALVDAHEEDFIYVGGSSFVVADLLTDFDKLKNIVSNHIN